MSKKRNQVLNVMEAIAAYLVILIHYPLPGVFGNAMICFARFSVPMFYVVSGFFLYRADQEKELQSIPKKIGRLMRLFLASECIYFLFQVALEVENIGIKFQAVKNAVATVVGGWYLSELPAMLLVLEPPFNVVCWFVTSLIVVYALFYLLLRFSLERYAFAAAPVLVVIGLVFRRIAIVMEWDLWYSYERFLLFIPAPFFTIGYYIHTVQEKIQKSSDVKWIVVITAGMLLTFLEFLQNETHTLYFGTCLMVIGCMAYASRHPDVELGSPVAKLLNLVGERYTMVIYIMHNMIGWILSVMMPRLIPVFRSELLLDIVMPFAIAVASTCLAVAWDLLTRFISRKKLDR